MGLPNKYHNEYRSIKQNTTEIARTCQEAQRLYEVPKTVNRIEVSTDRLSSLDDQWGLNINKSLSNGRQLSTFKTRLPKITQYPYIPCTRTQNNSTEQEREALRNSSYEKGLSSGIEKGATGHKDVMNRHSYLSNKLYNWRGHTQFNTSFISTTDVDSRYSQYGEEYTDNDNEECYESGGPDFIVLNAKSRQYPESALEIDMVSSSPSLQRSITKMPEDIRAIEQVYGGYNCRLPHKLGSFEQSRDSGIYKRTRHLVKSERPMKQWPVGLELSGRSVIDEDLQIKDLKDSEGVLGITDEPLLGRDTPVTIISGRLPPLADSAMNSPRSNYKTPYSSSFYTDYGLKTQRTDLFSGYKRRRKAKSASEAELEKELEAKARRHIYACQVLSSVKKASKTAQNVSLLRKTLGPSRLSSSGMEIPGHFKQIRPSSNFSARTTATLDTKRSLAFFIRTRETSNMSHSKINKNEGLPEISGRTVILGVSGK